MRRLFIATTLVFCSTFMYAQNVTHHIEWEKTYGGSESESARSSIPTSDGGFLLGAITNSNDGDVNSHPQGDGDFWVVKVDSLGNLEWENTYGGSLIESLSTMVGCKDGGYILGGSTWSSDGDVHSGNKGNTDFWIVKIDSVGNIKWEKTYGGSKSDQISQIINTFDGGYLLGGYTYSNDGDIISENHGSSDLCMIKIDSVGNIEWLNTYGTEKRDYSIIGLFESPNNRYTVFANNYEGSGWLIHLDENGTIEWEKNNFGSELESGKVPFSAVISTDANSFFMGGTINHGPIISNGEFKQKRKLYISKTDSLGNIIWLNQYNVDGLFMSINTCDDSTFLCGGIYKNYDKDSVNFYYDAWYSKYSFSGDLIWENYTNTNEYRSLRSIHPVSDDEQLLFGAFNSDLWVTKTSVKYPTSNIQLTNNEISENSAIGTLIGEFTSEGDNLEKSFTYRLVNGEGGNDNHSFLISNDQLYSNAVLNFEERSHMSIRVQSKDNFNATFEESFIIEVSNQNDAPNAISFENVNQDSIPSFFENLPKGTEIATLFAADEDTGDVHTFRLVEGEGDWQNHLFSIDSNKLLTDTLIDFESLAQICSIRVETIDSGGLAFSQYLTLQIINEFEMPFNLTLSNFSVDENIPVGSEIGQLNTVGDAKGMYTYNFNSGVGGEDNDKFLIDGDRLITNASVDYEEQQNYSICITTTDQNGNSFTKTLTIGVNNLNDIVISNVHIVPSMCNGDENGEISFAIGDYIPPLTFEWSNGDSTQNLLGLGNGFYDLTVTDSAGMFLNATFEVPLIPLYQGTSICYVTGNDNHNTIFIDKGDSTYNEASYIIFRETNTAGNYTHIAEIPADQVFYTDSAVDNRTQSYSYKVTMRDKCGKKAIPSEPHNTIHLSANIGINAEVNLYWNNYQGLSPSSYSIYRKTDNGDFKLLKELSSSNNTFSDFDVDVVSHHYQYYIAFPMENACGNVAFKSGSLLNDVREFVMVKSNPVEVELYFDAVQETFSDLIHIYPNPATDDVNIRIGTLSNITAVIMDLNGRVLITQRLTNSDTNIPLKNISQGIYVIKLIDNLSGHSTEKKLVKN